MASYNHVALLGNVTRDIELRQAGTTSVTDIGLAINDRVKRGDQWVEEPTFVDVTCWGRTAEIAAEFLRRGSQVMIDGRLKLESWEKDGQKRTKLKVICDKLVLVGSKRDDSQPPTQSAPAPADEDVFF